MDARALERIIIEEVQKALAESGDSPGSNAYLDPDMSSSCTPQGCRTATDAPAAPSSKPSSGFPKHKDPAALMLFSGVREPWQPLIEEINAWHAQGIGVDALLCADCHAFPLDDLRNAGVTILSPCPSMPVTLATKDHPYSAVVVPGMSRTCAAKSALGITDNLLLQLLYAGLSRGVPTYASTEGMDKNACATFGNALPGVQETLERYQNQLTTMGIRFGDLKQTMDAALKTITNQADSDSNLIMDLITEDVAATLDGPVIKVARGGLVTPLAQEHFAKRGIEIQIVPQS